MDTAYLHIVTNHIPIVGVPFAAALLVLGIWKNSDDLKSAAFLSFFALGLVVILVYLTGEPAEELVENIPGVGENAIDDHEDFAFYALGSVLATGAVSGIAFLLFKGWRVLVRGKKVDGESSTYPVWLAPSILVLALISSGVLSYTGKLGGMIRHTEFYGAAPAAEADEGDEAEEREEEEDDDRSGRGRGRNRGGDR
ncbi:MAG TPA: hypothetical protein VMM38_03290 [Aridibacter sp.]|nr:hypothetical protein [Aridibacter sp.]